MQPVKPDRTAFQNITVNLVIQAETEDNGTLTYQWYKASGADEKEILLKVLYQKVSVRIQKIQGKTGITAL